MSRQRRERRQNQRLVTNLPLKFATYSGDVAEWFKATVLKTVEGLYPSVSSNLTVSAKFRTSA